jgi:hypothetical protein
MIGNLGGGEKKYNSREKYNLYREPLEETVMDEFMMHPKPVYRSPY